jgi:DNA-binding NarL/FixJ family response regulator
MKQKQVLILYENPLFAEGLVSILKQERGFKVESLEIQRQKGSNLINMLRPDVVILEGSKPMVNACSTLRELLKHSSKGRVISVDLNHNHAVVYTGIQLAATEWNLIKAVKNGVHGDFVRFVGKESKDESIRKRKTL